MNAGPCSGIIGAFPITLSCPIPLYFLPTPRLPIPPLTSMFPVSGALQLKTSGAHADCPMAAHTWPYSSADSPAPSSPRWQHSATTDVSRMEEAPWAVCWGGGRGGVDGAGERREETECALPVLQ